MPVNVPNIEAFPLHARSFVRKLALHDVRMVIIQGNVIFATEARGSDDCGLSILILETQRIAHLCINDEKGKQTVLSVVAQQLTINGVAVTENKFNNKVKDLLG